MKKTTIITITSLLLLASASAATLAVERDHIFTSEEFKVKLTEYGESGSRELDISFNKESKQVKIPHLEEGAQFDQTLTFTAPETPGTYKLTGDFDKEIEVEKNPIEIKELELDPGKINPRNFSKIRYTIKNVGENTVYDVEADINAFRGEGDLGFSDGKKRVIGRMQPEESQTKVVNLRAKQSAEGSYILILKVSYNFDEEEHFVSSSRTLNIGSSGGNLEIILVGLILLLAFGLVLKNYYY